MSDLQAMCATLLALRSDIDLWAQELHGRSGGLHRGAAAAASSPAATEQGRLAARRAPQALNRTARGWADAGQIVADGGGAAVAYAGRTADGSSAGASS